jgi:hypothetical protein
MRLSAVGEPPRTAGIRISGANSRKSRHIRKMTVHRHLAEVATGQRFCQGVFTRQRPEGDISGAAVSQCTSFVDASKSISLGSHARDSENGIWNIRVVTPA